MEGLQSFLDGTGQSRRLHAGLAGVVILGVLLWILVVYVEWPNDQLGLWVIAVTVCMFSVGAWLCLSIRCPRCRTRLVWMAASQKGQGDWYSWLTTLATCPTCSFNPSTASAGNEVEGGPRSRGRSA
jgi:hypothetical protein